MCMKTIKINVELQFAKLSNIVDVFRLNDINNNGKINVEKQKGGV